MTGSNPTPHLRPPPLISTLLQQGVVHPNTKSQPFSTVFPPHLQSTPLKSRTCNLRFPERPPPITERRSPIDITFIILAPFEISNLQFEIPGTWPAHHGAPVCDRLKPHPISAPSPPLISTLLQQGVVHPNTKSQPFSTVSPPHLATPVFGGLHLHNSSPLSNIKSSI